MAGDWTKRTIEEFYTKKGRGIGPFGDRLLLLTTRGAKTGETVTTPVAFHREGDGYVIVASKGGTPTNPAWYHNLRKHREGEIEVAGADGTERFRVRARPIAKGPERDRLYEAHAAVLPMFRDYPKKTSRIIPVVVLERTAP